ncbi:MAG: hypothetical protein WCK04_01210 [Actinomycetes bacterium]
MKTLNQIQGEVSPETWDSLVEHFAMQKQQCETEKAAALAAKDAEKVAAVEAEGRAVHNRLDALVQAGQEAHAAGDLDALGKVLVAAYGYTSGARRAKLEADLATAQSAVTAAADKLAAL